MRTQIRRGKHLAKAAVGAALTATAGCASFQGSNSDASLLAAKAARYPTLRPQQEGGAPAQTRATSSDTTILDEGVRQGPTPRAQVYKGRAPRTRASFAPFPKSALVLNFEGASIDEAAALVLGEFLNLPYEIHPEAKGVINLKSAEALSGEDALRAFETVLRQNKSALVQDGAVYRIVPEKLAIGYASAPQIGAGRPLKPGYTVQIVPLSFVSASEMAEIIKPLAGAEAVIRVDKERNLLLLAGTSRELSLWLETVETFDIDWFSGKSVGVFPLRQVAAGKVVEELEAIFAGDGENEDAAVKFLPIERTNSVMAITRAADLLDRVRVWTARLDADSGAARRLRVYSMKNAKATDVAPLLQEIFNAPASSAGAAQSILAPGETPSTSASPAAPGTPSMTAVSTARSATGGARTSSGLSGATLRIIPDESANTLLMMATQEEFARITEALRQLDVAPLQVLVEATIVEVTITRDLRYGVQYFLEGTLAQESAVATLSAAASDAILPTFPGASLVLGEPTKIVLDALEGVTDLNVISSPNLMVLDNQTARLVVGDQIPVTVQNVTNGFTSNTDNAVLFNSIEFRDTGVIFEVTPRISSDGFVALDIVQEVSTVAATSAPTLTPTISQRRIESSVVAQSGQTIVLGGLFSDSASEGRSGLPVVSRAPLFGGLFGNTTTNDVRTELVVLIQPRILRNEAEARAITREFQDRVQGLRLLAETAGARPVQPQAAPQTPYAPAFPASEPTLGAPDEDVIASAPAAPLRAPEEPTPAQNALAIAPVRKSLSQPETPARVSENDLEEIPLETVLPTRLASAAPPAEPMLGERVFVQLGAFDNAASAARARDKAALESSSLGEAPLSTKENNGIWRLVAGPLPRGEAQSLCDGMARACAVVME